MHQNWQRLRPVLDVVATVALIAASGTLMWTAWKPRVAGPSDSAIFTPQNLGYVAGDKLGPLPDLDLSASPATLVLYLRSGCKYCTASMAFYRRLAEQRRRARIVVIGTEPLATLQAYVSSHSFRPDQVISVPSGTVRFRGTPSLALVGSDATIQAVWRGQLGPQIENDVEAGVK
jgi:hypothetical protein